LILGAVIRFLAGVGAATSGTAALTGERDDARAADARHDYRLELRLLTSLAAAGNARGQAMLGDMYYFGAGVTEDYAEAARWYRMAAERGDPESQFNIRVMYECGTGVPQDLAQARAWLTLSAVQGDTTTSGSSQ
jgi:TPR repeat protein